MNKNGKKATIDDEKSRPVKKASSTRNATFDDDAKKRSADKRQSSKRKDDVLKGSPLNPESKSELAPPKLPKRESSKPVVTAKKSEITASPKVIIISSHSIIFSQLHHRQS